MGERLTIMVNEFTISCSPHITFVTPLCHTHLENLLFNYDFFSLLNIDDHDWTLNIKMSFPPIMNIISCRVWTPRTSIRGYPYSNILKKRVVPILYNLSLSGFTYFGQSGNTFSIEIQFPSSKQILKKSVQIFRFVKRTQFLKLFNFTCRFFE